MSRKEYIFRQAAETVEKFARFKADQFNSRFQRETHGNGCGCPKCVRDSARDQAWANKFLTHVEPDTPEEDRGVMLLPPGWKNVDDIEDGNG